MSAFHPTPRGVGPPGYYGFYSVCLRTNFRLSGGVSKQAMAAQPTRRHLMLLAAVSLLSFGWIASQIDWCTGGLRGTTAPRPPPTRAERKGGSQSLPGRDLPDPDRCARNAILEIDRHHLRSDFADASVRIAYAATAANATWCRQSQSVAPDIDEYRLTDEMRRNITRRSSAALVILSRRVELLKSCLRSVATFYASAPEHDVLVFHTGEFGSADITGVEKSFPALHIHFIELKKGGPYWSVPQYLSMRNFTVERAIPPNLGMGYRHMCRFWARLVFYYVYQLGYDWIFRLDDDSLIHSAVRYNLANMMEEVGALYGYRIFARDFRAVMQHLPEAVHDFLVTTQRDPVYLYLDANPPSIEGVHSSARESFDADNQPGWHVPNYSNNFFIASVNFFMRPDVQQFLYFIDLTGGIPYFRWGDSPLLTVITRIFAHPAQVRWVNDFTYEHGGRIIVGKDELPPPVFLERMKRSKWRVMLVGDNMMLAQPMGMHV